ncbi:MAG: glycosyltransferase [Desulfobulbaceae bacterium]|nr:glycosyltransferase [Desulfobulbaceae bacterium]
MASMINLWKKNNKPMDFPPTLPSGKEWPKISIITPSFNQGAFIEDTILSVLLQGYPNTEHIIVDAGSTDGTLEVLGKYEHSLAKVISEPDNGQSDAINKGMRLATGDILTWLNSDDMLAPGALAAIAMAFDTSNADLVAGICKLFLEGREFASHLTSCPDGPLKLTELLDMEHYWQAGMYFYQPEVMFSRELWERAGGYVDESLHFCMDCELFLRFSKHDANLHVIGHPVAWFRYHEAQKTNDTNASPDEFKRVCREMAKAENIDLSVMNDKGPPLVGRPLNVAMVNDIGSQYGAGIAHKRLGDALAMAGHSVSYFTLGFNSGDSRKGCSRQIRRVLGGLEKLSPDLVVCGNLHGFSPEADFLVKLLGRWPVALCVHDLWLLTGKCPHPFDCNDYITGCSEKCQVSDAYPALAKNIITKTWHDKRKALGQEKVLLLCNSTWTYSVFANALGGDRPQISRLAMGASPCFFEYHSKVEARDYFDLPQDKFIILLASVNITDPYKGKEALEQIDQIQDSNTLVVSLGVVSVEVQESYPWLRQLGLIDEPEIMCKAYAAADIHVSFSRTETLGQSFFEAAACGTPSIGYRTTGITDSVTDGVTGVLVDLHESLLGELEKIRENHAYRKSLSAWATVHSENARSLYNEYHSFYQALRETGLIPMEILGRKIGFTVSNSIFPDLTGCVQYTEMLQYLGPGWSVITSKGVFSTADKSIFKFSKLSDVFHQERSHKLELEVSAHWSVSSSILKLMLALGFYALVRGDNKRLLNRFKKVVTVKRNPLVVDVLLNDKKIGEFSLNSRRRRVVSINLTPSFLAKNGENVLTFKIHGAVVLSEIGVCSERRKMGFLLHRIALV